MPEEKNKVEMIEHDGEPRTEVKTTDDVVVSKIKLDDFMTRMDNIEKENEILRKSVSSAKYNFEKDKMGKDKVPTVKFKLWQGVPIIGYKSLAQELIKSPVTGEKVAEKIQYEYTMASGDKLEISFQDFYTITEHAVAHVVSRRVENGEEIFTCEFVEPELNDKYGQLDVPIRFINL